MLPVLFFAFATHGGINEAPILETFKKAPAVYKRFLRDTLKYRDEAENFNEKEFEPAVEKMIALLNKGRCETCVSHYLNGLSYLEGSASENLTEQLKRIIEGHPNELNIACKKISREIRKGLSIRFRDAIGFMAEERKSNSKDTKKQIPDCF